MKKAFTLFTILLISGYAYAQQQLEINLGAGYTAVDLDQLIIEDEVAGTNLLDWDQFAYGGGAQFFFKEMSAFTLGAEVMYQYLYWYQVRVPFGSTPITREYDISTVRITPILRFGEDSFAFDVGPEFNFASGGFEIGLLLSGNYYIPVNDQIDIPLKFRVDVMNGIVLTAPLSLNTGVRIKM